VSASESETGIPDRLLRKGRPPCQHFEPDEQLFHRIQKQHILDEGGVVSLGVRSRCFSVNRGRFSEPEDVLLPCHHDHGICAFTVADVPKGPCRPTPSPYTYTFDVVHEPEEENYAHSEVRAFRDGEYHARLHVPRLVNKRFRMLLGQRMVVVRQPLV